MRVAAVLVLCSLPAIQAKCPRSWGMTCKESPFSVEETMNKLQAVVESKQASGLRVLSRIDHAKNAKDSGLDLRPTQVLLFGNPKLGTQLMQCSQQIGIDLPMKAIAFEDEAGKVFLGYNDPKYLGRRHCLRRCPPTVQPVLDKMSGALDGLTNAALKTT